MKKTAHIKIPGCGQNSSEPVRTLVFLGDSITDGGHLWDEDIRALGQGYVRKIADSLPEDAYRLVNLGQDGFTSRDILRLLQREIFSQIDCLSLLIGVNDLSVACYGNPDWIPGRFTANIYEIFSLIRRFHTGPLIVMEPFLFPRPAKHLCWMPFLEEEQRILQDAAAQFGGLYLPLQNVVNHAASLQGESRITPDGIHLTEEGSRIVAEEWRKAYSAFFFS